MLQVVCQKFTSDVDPVVSFELLSWLAHLLTCSHTTSPFWIGTTWVNEYPASMTIMHSGGISVSLLNMPP